MQEAGGAAAAVALGFLGFMLLVVAVRGTYYDVWRALSAPIAGKGTGNG